MKQSTINLMTKLLILVLLFGQFNMPSAIFAEESDHSNDEATSTEEVGDTELEDDSVIEEEEEKAEETKEPIENTEKTEEREEEAKEEIKEEIATASVEVADIHTSLPFKVGDTSPHLITLKDMLNPVMTTSILVTENFGDYMKRVVEDFQRYAGLSVNGQINAETLEQLYVFHGSLKEGDRSQEMLRYKEQLNAIGFGNILVTEFFGDYTTNRVMAFQRNQSLIANGILDPVTVQALDKAYGRDFSLGDSAAGIASYKEQFNRLGFSVSVNQSFDQALKNVVEDFQKKTHLTVSGSIDFETRALLDAINGGIRQGTRDGVMVPVKRILNQHGYGNILETELFGSFMERQVKAFQKNLSLPETGRLDETTMRHMLHLYSGLKAGDRHDDLIDVKENLNRLGFSGILVTDFFGDFTTRQLKAFQRYYNLPVTGTLNEHTRDRLQVEVNRTFRQGQRNHGVIPYKRMLNTLGFGHITVTDFFGSFMESQVRLAQRYYGISETGRLDAATKARLETEAASLSEGDRDQALITYKEHLNSMGYGHIQVTNFFGSFTTQNLRAFQRDYNLRVNGVFDSVTVRRLNQEASKVFKQGDSNPEIRKIKEDLDRAGFGGILLTNNFGAFMKQQVEGFQRKYNLPVTGQVNARTRRTLNDAVANRIKRDPGAVVNGRQNYSYQTMQNDIARLEFLYPGLVETKVIGRSVDGRNLYAVKLGHGNKEIFINGSHHAREHMTTNVVMKMIDDYARSYVNQTRFQGYNTRQLLDDISIWFVPMVNPDGVMLVQQGASSAKNPSQVIQINGGSTDFRRWKSNIRGVDLNRQYPYLWQTIQYNPGRPSYHNYKGQRPVQEPEVIALYNFTNRHNFKAAISYHSSGEVIYTRYGYDQHTRSATEGVGRLTGYRPINLQFSTSGGGYTDWFLSERKGIAMTMEIAPFIVERPVPLSQWNSIYEKNRAVGLYIANYVRANGL